MSRSLRRRVLFGWLDNQGIAPSLRVLAPWLDGQNDLPDVDLDEGRRLLLKGGMAQVVSSTLGDQRKAFRYALPAAGETLRRSDAGWSIRVERIAQREVGLASGPGRWPASACLPDGHEGMWVRSWEPGDRYQPIGLAGGSKKLQDVYTDAKVPAEERWRIPVIGCGDVIWWVAGGEVGLPAKAEDGAPCLQVMVEEMS